MVIAFAAGLAAAFAVISWQGGAIAGGDNPQDASQNARQAADEALKSAQLDDKDRAAIEAVVRDYILSHPEIIPEAVERLQQKQQSSRLGALRGDIEMPYAQSWAGAENGGVTLIKYSDFACGYCRKSVEDVARLLTEDKDLKVVFQELPILSDESETAAKWAMAAARQGKYYAFYKAMFAAGRPGATTIAAAAKSSGLDVEQARQFIESKEAEAHLAKNLQIARELQFDGTPSWVVGDQLLHGAVGYDELKQAIAAARQG